MSLPGPCFGGVTAAYAGSVTKLRIALAQVNATVGDLDGNAELIVEWTRRAAGRGARVVVFPEMMLTGYPVEDLALRASFVEASITTLHRVAARLGGESLASRAVRRKEEGHECR